MGLVLDDNYNSEVDKENQYTEEKTILGEIWIRVGRKYLQILRHLSSTFVT